MSTTKITSTQPAPTDFFQKPQGKGFTIDFEQQVSPRLTISTRVIIFIPRTWGRVNICRALYIDLSTAYRSSSSLVATCVAAADRARVRCRELTLFFGRRQRGLGVGIVEALAQANAKVGE